MSLFFLRKHLPKASPERDNYVILHTYIVSQNILVSKWKHPEQFWNLATEIQAHNHTNLKSSLKKTYQEAKLISSWLIATDGDVRSPEIAEGKWGLLDYNNHGDCNRLNRSTDVGLKVVGLVGATDMVNKGYVLSHYMTSLDNKMIWSLCSATNSVDRIFAQRYLNRCVEILRDHIQE